MATLVLAKCTVALLQTQGPELPGFEEQLRTWNYPLLLSLMAAVPEHAWRSSFCYQEFAEVIIGNEYKIS